MKLKSKLKVLICGTSYGAGGWTESTACAFGHIGCTVDVHYYNRSSLHAGVNQIRNRIANRLNPRLKAWPQVIRNIFWQRHGYIAGRELVDMARRSRPDLVLILKGELLRAQELREIKLLAGTNLVAWWVDDPFVSNEDCIWQNVLDGFSLFDHFFIYASAYIRSLEAKGARQVSFLPCAADPEYYRPREISGAEQRIYGSAASFVGTYYKERGKVIERLMAEQFELGLWGPGWDLFLLGRTGNRIPGTLRGGLQVPVDVSKVYNASQININVHHPQSKRGGLNNRAFEIPASRAFQLSDYVPEMEDLLEPGREVAVYGSPEEAVAQVRRYLNAPNERERIVQAGYQRVLGEHTYQHRVQSLLEAL